jgi:cysteinyl-tRNA synthetase
LSDRAHAPSAPLSAAGRNLHDRFSAAVDDDLDLPSALATIREALRADLPADERRWLVHDADFVLGLDLDRAAHPSHRAASHSADDPELARLVEERTAARASRDYAAADAIRERSAELGYEVTDEPAGPSVRRR